MTQKDPSQYQYRFFHPIHVRFIETDQQGHLFFSHFLTYFDVALTEYLKAIGYSYDKFLEAGVDFYYVESLCQYHGRAFFDEILHVHARIGKETRIALVVIEARRGVLGSQLVAHFS